MKKWISVILGILAWAEGAMAFSLSSNFKENGQIPVLFTCHGKDISPPLEWKEVPAKTKSFALIVDDPDAPSGTWDHWVLFNIPSTVTTLAQGATLSSPVLSGKNSWGITSYKGPCPPSGEHRYFFKLYALDTVLDLESGVTKTKLEKIMSGHVLGMAQLIGRFQAN